MKKSAVKQKDNFPSIDIAISDQGDINTGYVSINKWIGITIIAVFVFLSMAVTNGILEAYQVAHKKQENQEKLTHLARMSQISTPRHEDDEK